MNVLLIENKKYESEFHGMLAHESLVADDFDNVESIALKIKEHPVYDLIFINARLVMGHYAKISNFGIKLMKLLRLHKIESHVVLYCREEINNMALIDYAFVHTKGVSYYTKKNKGKRRWLFARPQEPYYTPNSLNKLSEAECVALSKERANIELEIKPLFWAENNPDSRHFSANLFGLWQLVKAHAAFQKEQGIHESNICDDFINVKKNITSYDGLLAQFVYNYSFEVDEDQCKRALEQFCNKRGYMMSEFLRKIKKLHSDKPNIIYVDDMADKGWSTILQHIIYGKISDNFYSINPTLKDDPSIIVENILDKMKKNKETHLIILDIRLHDERGYVNPSDLSGFQVMQMLNNKNIACPIMMLTASNKIWSMQKSFDGNALSFWIKGRMEEGEEGHTQQYLDLLDQVISLVGVDIKSVYNLMIRIKDCSEKIINNTEKYWWEKYEAKYTKTDNQNNIQEFDRKTTEKSTVIELLNKATDGCLNDLRQLYFHREKVQVSDIFRTMIIRLSYILEEIHRTQDSEKKDYIEPDTLRFRMNAFLPCPSYNSVLCNQRNYVAHLGTVSTKNENAEKFVKYFTSYLLSDMTQKKYEGFLDEEKDGTCVIDQRQSLLNKGESIKVTIIEKIAHPDGGYLNFIICKKPYLQKGVFIKETSFNSYSIGDVITVKQYERKKDVFYKIDKHLNISATHNDEEDDQGCPTPLEKRMELLEQSKIALVEITRLETADDGTMTFYFNIEPEIEAFVKAFQNWEHYSKYEDAQEGDILKISMKELNRFCLAGIQKQNANNKE